MPDNKDTNDIKITEDDLLSLKEVRQILGVGQNKMYELVKKGEIPHVKGIAGTKIRRGTLHKYIMSHEVCSK